MVFNFKRMGKLSFSLWHIVKIYIYFIIQTWIFLWVKEDNSHKHIYRCKKQKLDILEQTGHTFCEGHSLLSVLWAPEILNEDVTSQAVEA